MNKNERVIIAVDAMGGDLGVGENVAGTIKAIENSEYKIGGLLTGYPKQIEEELAKHQSKAKEFISVVEADSVVQEGERPFRALTQKPSASIFVAAQQVQEGNAHALISAGNTGATYVAANVAYGPLPGLERGMICGNIFGFALNTFLLDLGALVDVSPRHLFKLGMLGTVMSKWHGTQNPRLALLNIGAEAGKGNRQVKETAELFEKSSVNYIGSIEPLGLVRGEADVVICDGFVGNIVLKLTEALGQTIKSYLTQNFGHLEGSTELINDLYKKTNRSVDAGAAPIVGLNGVALVSHGLSTADIIANGILSAYEAVIHDLPGAQRRLLETLDIPNDAN